MLFLFSKYGFNHLRPFQNIFASGKTVVLRSLRRLRFKKTCTALGFSPKEKTRQTKKVDRWRFLLLGTVDIFLFEQVKHLADKSQAFSGSICLKILQNY